MYRSLLVEVFLKLKNKKLRAKKERTGKKIVKNTTYYNSLKYHKYTQPIELLYQLKNGQINT